jgi:NitT/TauT family transport system substrate-binding protein
MAACDSVGILRATRGAATKTRLAGGSPSRDLEIRMRHITTLAAAAWALLAAASGASALDKVTFGTNWLAEAEHGGFYQAVVDGTYAKYGLEVKILPGGPQSNNALLLPTGRIDFYMGGNLLHPFNAVEQNVPIVAVAAIFQKDPQVFMSHPGQGLDRFEDLKNATIFVGKEALASIYQWMRTDYGFKEDKVKPYTFNPAPFIADKKSAQQGYVTSEPYAVEKQGGFKPNVFLLADHGFNTYSTLIETRPDFVAKNPDVVQRFVDASIVGWYNYLYGDNAAANAAIKKDNPEITDDLIAFSIARMKDYGIVDSGEALQNGIGAMSDEHIKSFFDKMTRAGVVKPGIDYKKAFTLQFVNKKVGMELKK